jgi:hypothetical protein
VWLRKLSQSSRSGGSLSVASSTAPRPLEIETAGDALPRKLDYVPGMTPQPSRLYAVANELDQLLGGDRRLRDAHAERLQRVLDG